MDAWTSEISHKIEELEAELARLRDEVTRRTGEGGPSRTSDDPLKPSADPNWGPLTRRSLLSRAAWVTAGGIGLAAVGQGPAAAGTDGDVLLNKFNSANDTTAIILGASNSNTAIEAFRGESFASVGVLGICLGSKPGLRGFSGSDIGAYGKRDNWRKRGNAPTRKWHGGDDRSRRGWDRYGFGNGVRGEQANADASSDGVQGNGVFGMARGLGNSVMGWKPTGTTGSAVLGRADGAAIGIEGSSVSGRAGVFESTQAAQIRLVPSASSTHPAKGAAGDLFLDAARRLWLAKGGSSWIRLG